VFALLVVGCGIFGLLIGSFLNVVIYRVPRNESVISPPSACPYCGTTILRRDNVPVLSWLILRGKCRTCEHAIPVRYPAIESVTGILFAGAALRLHFDWALPAFLFFVAGLIALSWIDVEHLVLPKRLVYAHLAGVGLLLLLAAALTHDWRQLLVSVACSAGWWFLFFILNLINPRWLGFGDVRFALVLGLSLGWLGVGHVILGFFTANLVGAVVGLVLISTGRIERSRRIPYGVFLSTGALVALYFGSLLLGPFNVA